MPIRTPWEPAFEVGHALVDDQHRALLDRCNRLADHCQPGGDIDQDRRFDQAFDALKALARAHFDAEAALLAERGYPDLEDHQIACDEFDYLVDEIVTTDHFDRLELQRFLVLWWTGHVAGTAPSMRSFLAGDGAG